MKKCNLGRHKFHPPRKKKKTPPKHTNPTPTTKKTQKMVRGKEKGKRKGLYKAEDHKSGARRKSRYSTRIRWSVPE